ncbi:long-chain fatty acid--CoA ligase [Streptomyces sp. NPDC101225]|uniref:long-chain-fatty-acid--CoA ligase n=1 Tax=Streptomyces sp. NPDC101225 TaxID=3366135 RepID=UPI003802F729
MSNLALNLYRTAQSSPDRVALRIDKAEVSYAELGHATSCMARTLLDAGVRPGDAVGLMLPNVPHFAVAYHAILQVGAIVVPMNVLLKEREVAHALNDSGAGLIVVWADYAAQAEAGARAAGAAVHVVGPEDFQRLLEEDAPSVPVQERADGDTAVLIYTSGTTGIPKGAEITHHGIRTATRVLRDIYRISSSDVLLATLPLFHAYGQVSVMNAAILAGAEIVMMPRFQPDEALALIERHRISVFQGVPTMFNSMTRSENAEKVDTSSLRCCVSGGSSIPPEVLRSFQDAFGDVPVLEGYGLSETSAITAIGRLDRPHKVGSVGFPIEGVEVKITDDSGTDVPAGTRGEILVRGWNVVPRYHNMPEATAEAIRDGWLYTGDIGLVDDDGYVFITGRKKEMIIRGGYNVYPREIEDVLHQHPAVREAAVIGIPDELFGEEVAAAIVLHEGFEDLDLGTIRDFVKERVAAYRYPRHLWTVDALPRNPSGKILKREIRPPKSVGR